MNKSLRKLASLFGGSKIPQVGMCATLEMDKLLLREKLWLALKTQKGSFSGKALRNNTFCYVVKAGFKKSVVKVHGLLITVSNEQLTQK